MRRKTVCLVSLFVLLIVMPSAIAQTSRQVAIHAGHVLEVKSGKMLSDQMLLIEDGKIVSINSAAGAKVASDTVRIELPNATVLPGFIDAHTHLTMDPKFGYETLALSTSRQALIGARNARLTLLARRESSNGFRVVCVWNEMVNNLVGDRITSALGWRSTTEEDRTWNARCVTVGT